MGAFPMSHILNSTQLALPESLTQIRLTDQRELDHSASRLLSLCIIFILSLYK